MGSGGTSGEVAFPPHMEDIHKDWLGYSGSSVSPVNTDMIQAMNAAFAADPYGSLTLTDPSSLIDEVDTEIDSFKTMVDGVDEETDYDSIVDNAVAKLGDAGVLESIDTDAIVTAIKSETDEELTNAIAKAVDAIDDDVIEDMVKAFDKRSQYAKARATRRFTGTMAGINAVQSSAFLFGLAMIEAEHVQSVNEYNKEVSHQAFQDTMRLHVELYRSRIAQEIEAEIRNKTNRDQLLQVSIQLTSQMLQNKLQYKSVVSQILAETKRIEVVAKQEYEAAQGDIDARAAEWDMHIFDFGGQLLGSMGGGQRLPEKPSKAGSAIGGALSGAVSGAMATGGNPIGIAAGAALGLGSSLLS